MTDAAQSSWYLWQGDNLLINCRIQPRASADSFAEILDDAIKIRITAPPVDGKANAHLIKFLASQFKVAKQQVSIIKGDTSRQKRVRIDNPQRLPPAFDTPA